MKMKKLMSGIVAGTVALSAFASMSFTSSAEDATPIHTFKTSEKEMTNKKKTAADKIINDGLKVWATAWDDGSNSYQIANPWNNDLFNIAELDSATFVIKTTSDNFNGSLGYGVGDDYEWSQIDFKVEDAMSAYRDAIEEEEIESGDTYLYDEEDNYTVEISEETEEVDGEDVTTYTYSINLFGFHDLGYVGNTMGSLVELKLNGMNATCTEPTLNSSNKYDWTQLSTEAYLMSYSLYNEASEEIYDAADPDAHKLPAVEGSGVWTDKGEGAYAYAWAGAKVEGGLDEDENAATTVAVPEVDQTAVRALTAKVTVTGIEATGQIGINGYVEDPETESGWTTASFESADEDGIVTISLPNGVAADEVILQMFSINHNTTVTVSDLTFVLDDGTEVPFYTETPESEDIYKDGYAFYQVNGDKTAVRFVHKVPEADVTNAEKYPDAKVQYRTFFGSKGAEEVYDNAETNKAYRSIYVSGHKYTSDGDLFFVTPAYDNYSEGWTMYCGFYDPSIARYHAVAANL